MNLRDYALEDVFLAAIRSEVDSAALYASVAKRVKNAFLKDRMMFLSKEEERHRDALSKMFGTFFPGKEIRVPDISPVPLPEVEIEEGNPPPLAKLLEQAMAAEKAAQAFYIEMSKLVAKDRQASDTLRYFAAMEGNHYRILEAEKANAEKYDDYDESFPMMHSGP